MTVRDALVEAERRLAAADVETPRVDAEWLVAHLLGTTRSGLAARLDDRVHGLVDQHRQHTFKDDVPECRILRRFWPYRAIASWTLMLTW